MTDSPEGLKLEKAGMRPAFPGEDNEMYYTGMTLRDWFAGQALAGLTANSVVAEASKGVANETLMPRLAADCYAMADAMLAERAK